MLGFYRRLVRSQGSSLAAVGVLLSAGMIVLFLVDLQTRYWDRIAAAKTDAQSFAKILAEHTALTFDDVDRVLLEAEAIRRNSSSGKYAGFAAANAALRQLQKSSSVLVAIGWTDAAGEVLAHSYAHAPPRRNISDMSHFIAQRDSGDARLFISPPYRSAVSDKWFTAASRRLNNADGSFAGIVSAPIDQSYFTQIYRSIDLGKGGSVVLLHREGRMLAREPEKKEVLGKSFADTPLLTKYLPASETGSFEAKSIIDGEDRVVGYRAVPGLPLVLVVTYARSDVLKPWYRHVYTFGLLVVALVSIMLFGTFLLVQQTNALAANTRVLARTNARFDAALSNMPHGLSMFDANERLLVSNGRYREMYNLAEEQVRPGTPLKNILRDFETTSEGTGFDLDGFSQSAKDRVSQVLSLADERKISIQRTPMKDGGWVATHEDITEKRRAETLLAENSAELKRINDRFHTAISNMSQGLCLFDVDKKLVVSNLRFQEMYNLPDRLVLPGTPLQQILQHYVDRGETADRSVEEYTELLPTEQRQDYQPADGRQILIQRKPLQDGGWVATHEDVTEQRQLEISLAQKAADLERMNACFDAALNNMSQGLCLFDGDQKVAVSNVKFAEIYRVEPGKIIPGTSRRQLLEYRKQQRTEFASDASVDQKVDIDEGFRIEELVDGRFIAITNHRMSDGGWLTVQEDITERKLSSDRIAHLAHHDQLTGLANRARFSDKLDEAAKRCNRHGIPFTVLMLDLDKFKYVNDTLGHPAGDQLLIQVAQRLKSSLRDTDVLARLGGDEFAIIQEGESNQREGAIGLALRIIDIIGAPFDLSGNQANIGTSIGVAFAPECGLDAQGLLKKADLALYEAKSEGRNDYRLFKPEMAEVSDTQKLLEGELREAIQRDEFDLYYQPVVDAKTESIRGVEALVRWRHPTRGLVLPDQFIPLAESTGLMMPLGEWILQRACRDAASWPSHIKIAINISAVQFNNANIFDVVLCALVESGLSPERLELEITETMLLKNEQACLLAIRQLKNLGIAIVLDDFGIGYSSSSYLTRVHFDKIKIDKSFVQGFPGRRECAAIIQSVLALARGLDMAITAEGVETRGQFESLRSAGVDLVQGHLFGRAVPLHELVWDAGKAQAKNVA